MSRLRGTLDFREVDFRYTEQESVLEDFSLSIPAGQTIALHFETYVWRFSNAGITVTVSGIKQDITADLAKAAVSKTDSNVQALARK